MTLHPQSAAFLDRVKAGVSSIIDLRHLSTWMEKNTSHPKDSTKPWSFKDHEYQIDIVNDDAREQSVQKCSQIGASEVQARILLALLAVLRDHTAIYTMPTTGTVEDFAKSRIDTIIANSPILSGLIDPDLDNVKLKKIGSSFAYFRGTFTQKAAISVPADILITDEVNFSDPKTLTTYASRLGHAVEGGIRRRFSTPTLPGVQISDSFDKSSQAYYGVKCDHCHKWVFPNFMEHVIIPGFQDDIDKFTKEDLRVPQYDINGAFLSCPECKGPLTQSNLCDPEKRQWAHKYPSIDHHGYQIFPYDVPKINPIPKTLKHADDYARHADWVNFKVGLPFADAETSFLMEIVENCRKVLPRRPPTENTKEFPGKGRPRSAVMGIDISKNSYVVIGESVSSTRIELVWAEQIKQTGEGALLARLVFLAKWFQVAKACVDAGPDFTTSMGFVEAFPMGRTFANYYTRAKSRNTLSHIALNEEEGILSTVRTESFDLLAKKVNASRIGFTKIPETEIIKDHLQAMKRTEFVNNQGEAVVNWINTGPDHYAHALNYLNIAATLLDKRFQTAPPPGVLPMAAVVKLKQPK